MSRRTRLTILLPNVMVDVSQPVDSSRQGAKIHTGTQSLYQTLLSSLSSLSLLLLC